MTKSPATIIKEIAKITYTNQFQVEGNTPFHVAALMGNLEVFQFILEKSSNKNQSNGNGSTSLHLAAMEGHYNICKMIIEGNKINVNIRNKRTSLELYII